MQKSHKGYIFVLSLFFVYLLAQYQHVYLYYDDYGYCTLTYGYDAGITGNCITLKKMADWLVHSYTLVNGRIFTNLVFVAVAWLGNIKLMRIFFPACITGIYYLIYSETVNKLNSDYQKVIGAIILALTYGIFDIGLCWEGLYWFAAAFGYVVPMLLFLIFIKLHRDGNVLQHMLAFLLCLSCEQMVAMVIMYLLTDIGLSIIRKKKFNKDLIALFLSLTGGIIMVLSPASRGRMTSSGNIVFYEANLLEKFSLNISSIIRQVFSHSRILFVTVLLLLLALTSLNILIKDYGKILKAINAIYAVTTLLIWFFYVFSIIDFRYDGICVTLFVYLIIGFTNLIVLYIKENIDRIPLITAGMASIGLLLIVPEIPERTLIPFTFILIFIIMDFTERIMKHRSKIKLLLLFLCIPYAVAAIINMSTIYTGYKQNDDILKYNEAKLIEARELLLHGVDVREVQLYRLRNDTYSGAQVYQEHAKNTKYWMDKYYLLPKDIVYIYYDYATRNNGISVSEHNGILEISDIP